MKILNYIFIWIILLYSIIWGLYKTSIQTKEILNTSYTSWFIIWYLVTFITLNIIIHYFIYRIIKWKKNDLTRMIIWFTVSTVLFILVN